MPTIREWWRRFLPQPAEPTNGTPPVMEESPYPILVGIYSKGSNLVLTSTDKGQRGFKQVIVNSDLLERYNKAANEWLDVQEILASLPTSNRKRKRRAKSEDVECVGTEPEPGE